MAKVLPKDLTSYDLLKALAVALMITDHVGYFFFVDEMWWRVAGRLCVPIWFFLIGYAKSRDLGWKLWAGGVLLIVSDFMVGHYFIPLNILFSMLLIRMTIDPLMKAATRNFETLAFVCIVFAVFSMHSAVAFEYGFSGFILAMFGWLVRHQDEPDAMGALPQAFPRYYMVYAFAVFVTVQSMSFGMTQIQTVALAAGTAAVFLGLYEFRPMTYPGLSRRLGGGAGVLRLLGRRTLEIYVGHLVLFKFLALLTQPGRFQFMHLKWVWAQG